MIFTQDIHLNPAGLRNLLQNKVSRPYGLTGLPVWRVYTSLVFPLIGVGTEFLWDFWFKGENTGYTSNLGWFWLSKWCHSWNHFPSLGIMLPIRSIEMRKWKTITTSKSKWKGMIRQVHKALEHSGHAYHEKVSLLKNVSDLRYVVQGQCRVARACSARLRLPTSPEKRGDSNCSVLQCS